MTAHTRHLPEFSGDDPDPEVLRQKVAEAFAIHPTSIHPMGGYTNRNFLLTDASGQHYVLRVVPERRSPASLNTERQVLDGLKAAGYSLSPRPLTPTQTISPRWQLSHWLPGQIDCLWWQQCSIDKIDAIFSGLAQLHDAMGSIPGPGSATPDTPHSEKASDTPPFEKTPEPLRATPVGRYVADHWPQWVDQARRINEDITNRFDLNASPVQWIHGDIQLENILFEKDRLSGFLDFERVRFDYRIKDILFSAFRVCKEGTADGVFRYDRQRFDRAIETYRKAAPETHSHFFADYDKLWKTIFCLDQSMVYLENAFDGTWQLVEGIGFLPCFKEVLNYRRAE